jgi:hypothetical protein
MKDLEQRGSRAFYRPTGTVGFEEGVRMVADAIRAARDLGPSDILVDTTGVAGFGSPGAFDRYEMGEKDALAWLDARLRRTNATRER